MPELSGTVKRMSPSGKGFLLNEFEEWINYGRKYEGPRPFAPNAAITVTYEQTFDAGGKANFWALEAWPTTGQNAPPNAASPELTPTSAPAPTVTNGPTPAAAVAAPTGPTPVPPNREQFILYECCLARAQEWVLATEQVGSVQRLPAHVSFVADLYYTDALKVINGEPSGATEPQQDGAA